MGSAGFAVTSFFLGKAVEKYGTNVILYVTVAVMTLMVLIVFFFKKPKTNGIKEESEKTIEKEEKESAGFFAFAKKYPFFMVFLLGVACCFFAHNMINDFLIQIIRNLGGNETELGYATFLQAILELPVMALIGFVLRKVSPAKLLVFSCSAFFVKILILIFAQNMVWMFVSQSFQLFAYAVFIPAAAYYVSHTMTENDQVKGQAYVTSAITIGGVFSNLLSGVILDNLGMRPMLITGTAVCFAGVLISFAALRSPDRKGETSL